MRIAVVLALASAACGRVAFDATRDAITGDGATDGVDGTRDGSEPLPPFGAVFDEPTHESAISSATLREYGPTLSRDRRDIYFGAIPMSGDPGQLGGAAIYFAHRDDPAVAFAARAIVSAFESADTDGEPCLGSDETRLWFQRSLAGGLFESRFAGGMWNTPVAVAGFATYQYPDLAVGDTHVVVGIYPELYEFRRPTVADAWEQPKRLSALEPGAAPSLREDGLEIFFESDRDAPGINIYRATRAALDQPWSPVEKVSLGSTDGTGAGDPDISADGRTLVFVAIGTGVEYDVYIAHRDPL